MSLNETTTIIKEKENMQTKVNMRKTEAIEEFDQQMNFKIEVTQATHGIMTS